MDILETNRLKKDVVDILNNLEKAWSGASEAIEKLEDAMEIMGSNNNFEMENMDMIPAFDLIDEQKDIAESLQGNIQEVIDDITMSYSYLEKDLKK